MSSNTTQITEDAIHATTLAWMQDRGVDLDEVAALVLYLQRDFYPDLTPEECRNHVDHVLTKREVQNAILTGIQLDRLAEEKKMDDPLLDMILRDESLYGIDEILATSILNVYGSIGMTNYGYIDRVKPGILSRLDNKSSGKIHTFLDDLVGAVAASAASRLSHNRKMEQERGAGQTTETGS
ncbi:phosphatidylglycerophosphatase A family protein [Paludifilum halophilum]|uniref:Phosphatidylglycerophosphatase A n=1 Tax=Paludifilum halophilum TaxID=1642702 RepID=A0A235B5P3_9BACL|nr:phosphatidylglycerophosphatase A [Paludifilum halophilum]OYD07227.1 phosphatidylglycerophosphatase A [Paludifilum halophilum]